MANPQRATQLAKLHKLLKTHYKVVPHNAQLPLLELMVFAALLENSTYAAAELVYARLVEKYHDWNEIRVSTVTELAESMEELFEPAARAAQMKKVLQGVFEAKYTFDLELLKKGNLGAAVQELEKTTGASQFVIAFASQNGLQGHAIGLDRGAWELLIISGMATPQEAATHNLSGLERAIPKNKGGEFFSLLHQAGAEYLANTSSPTVKKLVTGMIPNPVWPKRGETALKLPPPPPKPEKAKPEPKGKAGEKEKAADKGKPTAKASDAKPTKGKDTKPVKVDDKSKSHKPADKGVDKKAAAAKSKPAAAPKKPAVKSPSKQLAKRKPR
jgi:hypothetical protein